jgi:TrwC relaxase
VGPGGRVSVSESAAALVVVAVGGGLGPDHHNTREILGFDRSQLRAFSKRSAQIEAELEAKGAVYESAALRMAADDEASLATRSPKDHTLTPSLLAGRWQREAERVSLAVGAELDNEVCFGAPALVAPGWEEISPALVDPEVSAPSRAAGSRWGRSPPWPTGSWPRIWPYA